MTTQFHLLKYIYYIWYEKKGSYRLFRLINTCTITNYKNNFKSKIKILKNEFNVHSKLK